MTLPALASRLDESSKIVGSIRPKRAEVSWLVDNDEAYGAIASAVEGSATSISISQLAFDADFCVPSDRGFSRPFIDLLQTAVRDRGVHVRILLNATLLIDTLKPLLRFLAANGMESAGLELRGVSFFPNLLHAKTVIVDSKTAFLVGSPFVNGYWDSKRHMPYDESRPRGELGGRPLHDVSVQVSGNSVRKIEMYFEELWKASSASGDSVARNPRTIVSVPEGVDAFTRVDTTTPGSVIPSRPTGSVEILESIEREIARARSLIYLEQQYLSSRRVFTALRAALDREPLLEIIIVSNQNPDITAYAQWQLANLREFGMFEHPRVGIFTLWSSAHAEGRLQINQVFVHSKALIVDERCAICGSANLDGVSLHSYGADFSGVGRQIFRNVRNFDVNATVTDNTVSALASSLQDRLWSEHLGAEYNRPRTISGWLDTWRGIAHKNIAALNSGQVPKDGAFILPFVACSKPSHQLRDIGIDRNSRSIELLFNPSWFERRFNLRWVRNMFL